jgi:putative SOS response-associated peptidase YedK
LLARNRCIVQASGFNEWKGKGKDRQKFYVYRKDCAPLWIAALWDVWTDPQNGERITSLTLITTAANGTIAPLHHRMPRSGSVSRYEIG